MLALLFGAISLLYATVGQAGGTAFLALMAFAAFPPSEMRPTALALNIVAAAYSTWVFDRNKVVNWSKLKPLLLSSLPTALIGGLIVLDERVYKTTTGIVLLLAGAVMVFRREPAVNQDRETWANTDCWHRVPEAPVTGPWALAGSYYHRCCDGAEPVVVDGLDWRWGVRQRPSAWLADANGGERGWGALFPDRVVAYAGPAAALRRAWGTSQSGERWAPSKIPAPHAPWLFDIRPRD